MVACLSIGTQQENINTQQGKKTASGAHRTGGLRCGQPQPACQDGYGRAGEVGWFRANRARRGCRASLNARKAAGQALITGHTYLDGGVVRVAHIVQQHGHSLPNPAPSWPALWSNLWSNHKQTNKQTNLDGGVVRVANIVQQHRHAAAVVAQHAVQRLVGSCGNKDNQSGDWLGPGEGTCHSTIVMTQVSHPGLLGGWPVLANHGCCRHWLLRSS